MKKFLFSALTCVAFATTGFASNEIVKNKITLEENSQIEKNNFEITQKEEFAPCQVEFWIYGADGTFIDYVHRLTDTETMGDCYSFAGDLMSGYERAFPGAVISEVSIGWYN